MAIEFVILDVDGVVKEAHDPYTLLHRHFGTEKAGERYLEAFLAGHISYDQFAQLDAGEWRGRTVAETRQLLRANPYVAGAHEMAAGLKQRRIPFVLLSSGFDLHVEDVAADLGADGFLCNDLCHDGERLLGSMTVRVPWGGKGPIVRDLIDQWGVNPAACLSVGDSVADIPAFHASGHAVAVRPRHPDVTQAAHLTLPDLTGLLEFVDSNQ